MIASCGLAHRASTVPLWNTAARCGAQDDDAKHDPSPGKHALGKYALGKRALAKHSWQSALGKHKGGLQFAAVPELEGRISPEGPPASTDEIVAADYLRAAQAYMLISMPTGTSTIFGAFQAIMALLLELDKLARNWTNLRPVH
jgi:hypothetical protein